MTFKLGTKNEAPRGCCISAAQSMSIVRTAANEGDKKMRPNDRTLGEISFGVPRVTAIERKKSGKPAYLFERHHFEDEFPALTDVVFLAKVPKANANVPTPRC